MPQPWSPQEITLIVKDYFSMLELELKGQPYNKKQHRTVLAPQLDNRSEGSIEFKHQNISAVLAEWGEPYIKGYKPRGNYQQLLEDQVLAYIDRHIDTLDPLVEAYAESTVPTWTKDPDFAHAEEPPPPPSPPITTQQKQPTFRGKKTNYLEKEQKNRDLGKKGEEFIVKFEKWRLNKAGRPDLAARVEWSSQIKGDGLGYDIHSWNLDGSSRYIEVKTTKLSKETPILLTANEIAFAVFNPSTAYLYRVFDAAANPKFFIQQGIYEGFCDLTPTQFKGVFK